MLTELCGGLVVTSIRVHSEGATLLADFTPPSRGFCFPSLRGWCFEWNESGKMELLLLPRIFFGFFLDGRLPYFGKADETMFDPPHCQWRLGTDWLLADAVEYDGPAFDDLARTRQAYLNIKNWNTRIHPVIAAIVPPGVK